MSFKFLILLFLTTIVIAQDVDSLSAKTPKMAVKRALMFPGGGQFYNNQPVKGGLLIGAALAAGFLYLDNANKYQSYNGNNAT